MSLQEIETAIAQLPPNDVAALERWFADYRSHQWDEQIAGDLDAGHLDELLSEVDQEYRAGLARPL
jgi:hypothetical protein